MSFLFVFFTGVSQNFNSKVEAIITASNVNDGILELISSAKNLTEANYSLRYEFSVITYDENNNSSKNAQSGRFTLEPFEVKSLSTTSVSIGSGQKTIILLVIYNQDDEVIGTAREVYNDKEAESKPAEEKLSYQRPNEGIELTGMVTENTKTKPGKDFYGFFYQKYSLSPEQGNKIISIDEVISFGRTTKIMVKVEDKIVFQFYARPKLDYLEEKADQALRQVNRYFEYLKNRSESINHY
ncbi:curli production assembly/transport protein CsgE [Gillisia sp. M10.2A]|uniref:Curli production assembly/transport component CsgE n=1 Tax=Gillisia lutea TaxID=2909668 RepID=A0ABS9EGP5_9FLAO|nr:curli production assembly/transport protein CsgE [Gillisia lutea]MCF4102049.1 curli production assembly/transport protein CsgE [Gillisia lutea]